MSKRSLDLSVLCDWLDQQLVPHQFKDYCPNGLQVQGTSDIRKIITGVTASEALIRAATEHQADAILVHHGWFWRGEDPRVIGMRHRRLSLLMAANISLIAYHLPLDAHPVYGNNIQLAHLLGLEPHGVDGLPKWIGSSGLIGFATLSEPITLAAFTQRVHERLGREPFSIGDLNKKITKVAWCTGAAHNMMQEAIDAGADVYLSGEVSEPTFHLAQESGVAYIAAGHHATERYGVQALGVAICKEFKIDVEFIDINNPI